MRKTKRIYGQWAGDPNGRKEDESLCIEEVWSNDRWSKGYQCLRKRGHGPNGLFCKQHGNKAEQNLKQRGATWFSEKYNTSVEEAKP